MNANAKEGRQNALGLWEYFALAAGFVLLWLLLNRYALGGPNSSDITWYYHVGANNLKETFILNRYFHIFLQKFFVGTQADPIQGLQFFWSFLLSSTALMLYLSARLLSPKSKPWNGILALLLFFSLPAIGEISGIPYVDVTAMLMLSALLLVYVVSTNFNHEKLFLLLLFGCLLFLGFKTKETVLPGAIMVFGFGLSGGRIGWRLWVKKLLWVCFGVLTGLAVLTILNALFLQDPLFGLRPEDIGSYMGSYFSNTRMALDSSTNASWMEGFFLPLASLPVLLYVVSGIQSRGKNSLGRQFVWLLPLAFITLLTLSINNKWGYQTRFALPVLPIVCALGAQVLEIPQKMTLREKLLLFASLALGIGLSIILLQLPRANFHLVYAPLLTIALLSIFFFFKNQNYRSFLLLGLLILLLVVPIYENTYAMVKEQTNRQAFSRTMLPFTSFSDYLSFSPGTRLLVDPEISASSALKILKNEDELFTTFNIAFNENTSRQNFRLANSLEDVTQGILSQDYDFILLSVETWFKIEKDPGLSQLLSGEYQHIPSPDNNYMLLLPTP